MSRRDPALDDISVLNDPNWTPPTANDIVSHTIATAVPTTTTATTTDGGRASFVVSSFCCFCQHCLLTLLVRTWCCFSFFYCSSVFVTGGLVPHRHQNLIPFRQPRRRFKQHTGRLATSPFCNCIEEKFPGTRIQFHGPRSDVTIGFDASIVGRNEQINQKTERECLGRKKNS